jgi:hypothetical protein
MKNKKNGGLYISKKQQQIERKQKHDEIWMMIK